LLWFATFVVGSFVVASDDADHSIRPGRSTPFATQETHSPTLAALALAPPESPPGSSCALVASRSHGRFTSRTQSVVDGHSAAGAFLPIDPPMI